MVPYEKSVYKRAYLEWSWQHFVALEILSLVFGNLSVVKFLISMCLLLFISLFAPGLYMFCVKYGNSSTYASMWRQVTKGFTRNSGLLERCGPKKL